MVPEAKRAAIRTWSSSTGLRRRTASAASREGLPWRYHTKAFHGRTEPSHGRARRLRPAGDASTPCPWQEYNRNHKKASLSAFRRWEVKGLGFDVKARLRPQRMASGGCPDPFALVGTIGKACGEASVVSVSGAPPGCVVVCFVRCWGLFLFCCCVDGVHVLTEFTH